VYSTVMSIYIYKQTVIVGQHDGLERK